MTVHVDEMSTTVEPEPEHGGGAGGGGGGDEMDEVPMLKQRLSRLMRDERRTAAWCFDD